MDHKHHQDRPVTIDKKLSFFIDLLDQAITMVAATDTTGWSQGKLEQMNLLSTNLKKFREIAQSGKLPRQSRNEVPPGTGLGLSRAVGEWCEDDALLDFMRKVEDYYRLEL